MPMVVCLGAEHGVEEGLQDPQGSGEMVTGPEKGHCAGPVCKSVLLD